MNASLLFPPDFSQLSTCEAETPPEQKLRLSICQRGPEPLHVKEEDHELWAGQQHDEGKEQVQEFNDARDSCQPQSSVCWETNEQEDTKPPLQPQNSESEEQFQDLQETKSVEYSLPVASTSQMLVQDGRENERPTVGFTNQRQTVQSSCITSRESTGLLQMTSVAEYRCHLCDKSFSSSHYLVNHAFRMHSKNADVLCAVCGRTSESTESLSVHLKSHKASKCCHVCGKHYNSTSSLTEHMASHTGVKLHRCHVCGKECSRKGDLKIHMRIHTGEKPFCCSYCCKSFTHSGHLRKHLRSHTGERPHQCNVCGKGFLQSTHLKYHLGTHAQKY